MASAVILPSSFVLSGQSELVSFGIKATPYLHQMPGEFETSHLVPYVPPEKRRGHAGATYAAQASGAGATTSRERAGAAYPPSSEFRAAAQPREIGGGPGFYSRVEFGANLMQDVEAKFGIDDVLDAVGVDVDLNLDDYSEIDIGDGTLDLSGVVDVLTSDDLFRIGIYPDPGIRFGLGVGYRFNEWFSAEFETGLLYNPVTLEAKIAGFTLLSMDADYFQVPFLVNGIVEIPASPVFRPYIGAGVGGAAFFMSGNDLIDGEGVNFAFQAIGGFKYQISDTVAIHLGYKFLMMPGLVENALDTDFWEDLGVEIDEDVMNHSGSVGVVVCF